MTSSRRRAGPSIDVVIASARWRTAPHAARLVQRTIAAAAPAGVRNAELSVILTSNRAIRTLNRRWRGQNKPTNVLSFPTPARRRGAPRHLGDVVIAYETVAAEARAAVGSRAELNLNLSPSVVGHCPATGEDLRTART